VVESGIDPMVIKAREIMSAPLITIESHVPLEEAARLMVRHGVKKLPVVDDGKLVGMITTSDLVRASPIQISIIEELLKIRVK